MQLHLRPWRNRLRRWRSCNPGSRGQPAGRQRGYGMTDLDALLAQATAELEAVTDLKSLDDCRVAWLGKQGKITAHLKNLGQLPHEERRAAGQKINVIKDQLAALIESR